MERRGKNQKRCESLNLYFLENLNLGLKDEAGGGGRGSRSKENEFYLEY